ncbi:exopolysaccharide biosynthesis protein [Pseudosulfitobacter pseudonitzschiae]|uniref:exopolysaccharide biosynthesis protein n=1 Tax=Pseudosulfitobacter pseudonitzschiae TaxID=1402135 RepID=UPI003B77B2ED
MKKVHKDAFGALEHLDLGGLKDRIQIKNLVDVLGIHAFPAGIFFFAALNVVPAVPGTSLVLGLPLVILCFRKLSGYGFWLPGIIMNMEIRKETLDRFHGGVVPYLRKTKPYLHPNAKWLERQEFIRGIDVLIFILSLSVLVPLPFTAMLPASCICLLSLGLMQKDYRWIIAGSILSLVALLIVSVVTYGSGRLIAILY